jgi:hypothetical protein
VQLGEQVQTSGSRPYFILDGISEAIDNITMPDKELSKLWADTNYMEIGYSGLVACLIRKLVDERKNLLLMRHAGGAPWTDKEEAAAEKLALCDFGIDPKTWE